MNYKERATDFLRALRGKRSQMALSKRLGFTYNQVYRWESGQTNLRWDDFVRYCDTCKADLKEVLRHLLWYYDEAHRHDRIVAAITRGITISRAARASAISEHKIERWRNGSGRPTLAEMLQLMQASTGLAGDFLHHLLKSAGVGTEGSKSDWSIAFKQLVAAQPLAAAVHQLFESPSYKKRKRHPKGFVAKRLGISEAEERDLIRRLETLGILERHRSKYRLAISEDHLNTTPESFIGHAKVMNFWIKRNLEVLAMQTGYEDKRTMMGYSILNVSNETYQKIIARLREFYSDINNLSKIDRGEREVTKTLVLSLFSPYYE